MPEGNNGEEVPNLLKKLREVSPEIYVLVIVALGVSFGAFLFKKYDVPFEEIVSFIAVGLLLYCLANVLRFLSKNDKLRNFLSLIVVGGFSIWWIYSTVFQANAAPTVQTKETIVCIADDILPVGLCTQSEIKKTTPLQIVNPPPGNELTPLEPNRVFVQFGGSIQREKMIALSKALSELGWDVQGADRGGERLRQAIGVNEVRYFNSSDRELADALASAVNEIGSPGDGGIRLRDLSRQYTNVQSGQLELWISR